MAFAVNDMITMLQTENSQKITNLDAVYLINMVSVEIVCVLHSPLNLNAKLNIILSNENQL